MNARFNVCRFAAALLASLAISVSATAQRASVRMDKTTLVSVGSEGKQGNGTSDLGSSFALSGDGRYVVFLSDASNLVPGDTNHISDVFVHDRMTGLTTRETVSSAGQQGNGFCWYASISGDGRYVAFDSDASNLVPGDTNGGTDIFVHDRLTGETTRVNVDSSGNQARYSQFTSYGATISPDGRYVAFSSFADNLVPGDTNGASDIFVHDMLTGETARVSVDSAGNEGNADSGWASSISSDGRYIAFPSLSTNLVPSDTNSVRDVFVRDRLTNSTSRVSVDSSGNEGIGGDSIFPALSADGRYVAFMSSARNLVLNDKNWAADIFVHDRVTSQTIIVSVDSAGHQGGHGWNSWSPSISADGRYVAFASFAKLSFDDLIGPDIFSHDTVTRTTTLITGYSPSSIYSWRGDTASISAGGRYVGFSGMIGLVPEDHNDLSDAFVRGSVFTLDASPSSVGPGQVLTLTEYTGVPGNEASLWALSINGVPTPILISGGHFGLDGTFAFSAVVPPGLAGLLVAFRGYGTDNSIICASNTVPVSFQ